MWASATCHRAHAYLQAALHAEWVDKEIDMGDPFGPTEDALSRYLDDLWVRGFDVLMAADQLQGWLSQCGIDDTVDGLHDLRSALVHLEKAELDDEFSHATARPDDWQTRSLLKVGGGIHLGLGSDYVESVLGHIALVDLYAFGYRYRWFSIDEEPNGGHYLLPPGE